MKECKWCNKELVKRTSERIDNFNRRVYCNRSCAGKVGALHSIKPIEDYFNNKRNIKSHSLRLRLIKENIKEYKCEECNNKIWNNKPIPLELHHKDGNHKNNNLQNLQILCPNCHHLTSNHGFRGKN